MTWSDLVGACTYDPGSSRANIVQVLRADRAAFVKIAETVRGLKPAADGTRPGRYFRAAIDIGLTSGRFVADP